MSMSQSQQSQPQTGFSLDDVTRIYDQHQRAIWDALATYRNTVRATIQMNAMIHRDRMHCEVPMPKGYNDWPGITLAAVNQKVIQWLLGEGYQVTPIPARDVFVVSWAHLPTRPANTGTIAPAMAAEETARQVRNASIMLGAIYDRLYTDFVIEIRKACMMDRTFSVTGWVVPSSLANTPMYNVKNAVEYIINRGKQHQLDIQCDRGTHGEYVLSWTFGPSLSLGSVSL